MTTKTHKTAIVIIPDDDLWLPIQSIRSNHDKSYRRWMPHITMIFPFRPREEFEKLAVQLRQACKLVQPFKIEFAEFRYFHHEANKYTIWLHPEPAEAIKKLQHSLWQELPDCTEVMRFASGFTPHLSVGQASEATVRQLLDSFQTSWQPISFVLRSVSIIWRNDPPDDIFRVDRVIEFGGI